MEIKNLSQFRGKMRFTTVTENGEITVSIGPIKYTGRIDFGRGGYFVNMDTGPNFKLFSLAGIVDSRTFMENVLGYVDTDGQWPWMKSPDDILKVLVELDKLYIFKEPEMEKPKSTEMEHSSIEDIDLIPKKKHYSFNFAV